MDRIIISKTWLLLILIVVISATIISVGGGGGQHSSENLQEKPSLVKMAIDTISSLKKSHQRSWDKVKSIIHEVQLRFFSPNLDFRGADDGNSRGEMGEGSSAGGRIKKAAAESIGSSKMTAEESAKSAANAAGEAVHKTTKKVKDTMSHDGEPHDEL